MSVATRCFMVWALGWQIKRVRDHKRLVRMATYLKGALSRRTDPAAWSWRPTG